LNDVTKTQGATTMTDEIRSSTTFLWHPHVAAAWNELLQLWGESEASGFSRLIERATYIPTEAIRQAYDSLPDERGTQKNVRTGAETRRQIAEIMDKLESEDGRVQIGRTIEAIILAVHEQVSKETYTI